MGVENTTFLEPLGFGPGPQASFGKGGGVAASEQAILAQLGTGLLPSSVWLMPFSLPYPSLPQSAHAWQWYPQSLFSRK